MIITLIIIGEISPSAYHSTNVNFKKESAYPFARIISGKASSGLMGAKFGSRSSLFLGGIFPNDTWFDPVNVFIDITFAKIWIYFKVLNIIRKLEQ